MIWRTRAGSASAGGRGSAICTSRRWCFSSTRGAMSAATSSTVGAQVAAARRDLELAGLDARDVEEVVDEVDEPVGRLQRDRDELELARREVVVLGRLQQLDEALDRRQRAAQLVRRRRDEVALGLLEARALGDVAQRPDDAALGAREARRGDRDRDAVVLDGDLAGQRGVERRQRARAAVGRAARAQLARRAGPRAGSSRRRRRARRR